MDRKAPPWMGDTSPTIPPSSPSTTPPPILQFNHPGALHQHSPPTDPLHNIPIFNTSPPDNLEIKNINKTQTPQYNLHHLRNPDPPLNDDPLHTHCLPATASPWSTQTPTQDLYQFLRRTTNTTNNPNTTTSTTPADKCRHHNTDHPSSTMNNINNLGARGAAAHSSNKPDGPDVTAHLDNNNSNAIGVNATGITAISVTATGVTTTGDTAQSDPPPNTNRFAALAYDDEDFAELTTFHAPNPPHANNTATTTPTTHFTNTTPGKNNTNNNTTTATGLSNLQHNPAYTTTTTTDGLSTPYTPAPTTTITTTTQGLSNLIHTTALTPTDTTATGLSNPNYTHAHTTTTATQGMSNPYTSAPTTHATTQELNNIIYPTTTTTNAGWNNPYHNAPFTTATHEPPNHQITTSTTNKGWGNSNANTYTTSGNTTTPTIIQHLTNTSNNPTHANLTTLAQQLLNHTNQMLDPNTANHNHEPSNENLTTTFTTDQSQPPPTYVSIAKATKPNATEDDDEGWKNITYVKQKPPPPIATKITSTQVWSDYEEERINNELDLQLQTRRIHEKRNDINRPVVWLRMHIAINAPTDVTPNLYEHEKIIDTIIKAMDLDFEIDRAWIKTKAKTFSMNDTTYFSTYTALTPNQATPSKELVFLHNLRAIEESLIQLFRDPQQLRDITNPQALINHYNFSLPAVNDYDEHLQFFIEGLDTSIIFRSRSEEIATQRELAAEIFRAFKSTYKETFPNTKLPPSISNIRDLHTTNSIISTRNSNIKETRNHIIGLAFSTHNPTSDVLQAAFRDLCITHKNSLTIGGNKIKITLHSLPIPRDIRQNTINTINESNRTMSDPKRNKLILDVPAPPEILTDPKLTTTLANNLKNCIGICVSLPNGRSNPLLCCLFTMHVTSTDISRHTITSTLGLLLNPNDTSAAAPTQVYDSPPPATRGRGRGRTPSSSNINKKLPTLTAAITTKNSKFHIIINGRGGPATSGIYFGHFQDDNIIFLVHGIPQCEFRSADTYAEAIAIFKEWYNDCNCQQDIEFMNMNAPLESSNLNNPCPKLRARYGPYIYIPDNPLEKFWTDNASHPIIGQLRAASSQRMATSNLNPSDSYDFLGPNYTGARSASLPIGIMQYIQDNIPLSPTHTNLNTTYSTPQVNLRHAPPTIPLDLTTQNTTPRRFEPSFDIAQGTLLDRSVQLSQINTYSQHRTQDDDVSEMSYQTSALAINNKRARTSSSVTLQTSPTRRHQPNKLHVGPTTMIPPNTPNNPATYIHFAVQIGTSPHDIRSTIESTSFPNINFNISMIDRAVHFSMITKNTLFKQAHIQILDTSNIPTIVQYFHSIDNEAEAHASSIPPPTGTCENDIDTTPPSNGHYPTNCRVIGCQQHRKGIEPNPSILDITDYNSTQEHGTTFHSDLLSSLPVQTLQAINWHKCTEPCQHMYFSLVLLRNHQQNCTTHAHSTAARPTTTIQASPATLPNHNRTDSRDQQRIQRLWNTCPRQHIRELETLLNSPMHIDDITNTVFEWIEQSTYISEVTRRKND